jgi:hypothetical protein
MTTKEMRERLIDEIRGIPDTRVAEVYDLIHFFRVGLEKAVPGGGAAADLMSFAGSWSDMPEEAFSSLATEWQERRKGAFARRRDHEADAG